MFNVENPVVRDELWSGNATAEIEDYDDEEAILANALARQADCESRNCKGCIWYKKTTRRVGRNKKNRRTASVRNTLRCVE